MGANLKESFLNKIDSIFDLHHIEKFFNQ